MPQRIVQTAAQTAIPLEVNGRSLLNSHEPISAILRSRLGQAHGDLLATPKAEADGTVTWSTSLGGEVLPAAQLPDDERARLERRAEQVLGDIRGLAGQMRQESATGQVVAQMLERATLRPAGDWLYSVGGKPVLVLWGHSSTPLPAAADAGPTTTTTTTTTAVAGTPAAGAVKAPDHGAPDPRSNAAAPAAATAAAAGRADPAAAAMADLAGAGAQGSGHSTAAASPSSAPDRPGGPAGRWRWLYALLALGLLAALALFALRACDGAPPAGDEGLDRRLAQAETDQRALEAELARRKAAEPRFICVKPPDPPEPPAPAASEPEPSPPAASEPEAAASEPETVASAPEPPPPPPSAPASRPEAPKRDRLAPVRERIAQAGEDCKALQAARQDPVLRGRQAETVMLRKELDERLARDCKPAAPVVAAKPPQNKEQEIRQAKNLCPGQRPKELAPELALVFDASGSMGYSLDIANVAGLPANPGDIVSGVLRGLGGAVGGAIAGGLDRARLTKEPTRMTAAKGAAITTVQRAPSDANIGLVRIQGSCSANSAGFYAPSQRGLLMAQLGSMSPNGGTPLADGVAKGGQMVDGVNREALMVVISDGAESCGRDPCAEARRLKQAKPYLKINVVDITGTGAANCLASITGGRVFTARNAAEVAQMTREASREVMAPENCPR